MESWPARDNNAIMQKSWQEPDEMLRLVLDTIPQFIFWKDRQSVYLGCNENFARIAGLESADEIVGKTDLEMPWRRGEAEFFREVDRRVMENDRAEVHIIEPQRQADGKQAWLDTSKVPIHDESGAVIGILGSFEDITDRIRREREQRAVVTVARSLRAADGREQLVHLVLEQILELLDAEGVALITPDTVTRELLIEAGTGSWKRFVGERFPTGRGITSRVLVSGEAYVNNDPSASSGFARPQILETTSSVAAVPLVNDDEVLAAVWIGCNRRIENADVELLNAIADMTASALRRISLHERIKSFNVELMEAYDSTLEGWARALELRDSDLEGHTRRVTDLAIRVGEALGLDHEALVQLRRGALLHDIGKMAIPDSILLKEEPLTNDEWRIMRRHPEFARDMLRNIRFLKQAVEIPYCHHERWDGSGYPRGLVGEDIPLTARIFAVVDVWDAVRSDRPYREAWPTDRAIRHLESNSGTLFDPKVVETFLRVVLTT